MQSASSPEVTTRQQTHGKDIGHGIRVGVLPLILLLPLLLALFFPQHPASSRRAYSGCTRACAGSSQLAQRRSQRKLGYGK